MTNSDSRFSGRRMLLLFATLRSCIASADRYRAENGAPLRRVTSTLISFLPQELFARVTFQISYNHSILYCQCIVIFIFIFIVLFVTVLVHSLRSSPMCFCCVQGKSAHKNIHRKRKREVRLLCDLPASRFLRTVLDVEVEDEGGYAHFTS